MFDQCLEPIWNYGKDDEYIQKTFLQMLKQLRDKDHKHLYLSLFEAWILKVTSYQMKSANV